MAISDLPIIEDDDDDDDDDDDEIEHQDDDDDEYDEEEEEDDLRQTETEKLLNVISTERVPLTVHNISIKGNSKTTYSLIESQIEDLKAANTLQDLLRAASVANARLQRLHIFDSVCFTLDSGPPGTVTVVVDLVESKNPLSGAIAVFSKPQAGSLSVEGSLKLKNLFGYGDLWDGTLDYGWDQTLEVSAGVSLPRFKRWVTPLIARASLLSQDLLKFSSYKQRSLGLSLGLISSKNHDLAYNLSWRTFTDPSQMSSGSVRRPLGHGLLSSLKYTFKIDARNSHQRPTRGYAFVSTTQIAGLVPDYRSLRFFRQEFDLRYALPLGFYHSALNVGVSSGIILPWGSGFLNTPSFLPKRFFLGGKSSLVSTLGGPTSVLRFMSRGLGPTVPQSQVKEYSSDESSDRSFGRDFLGGDLAVTAFADLSFDLPLRVFREAGIYGHAFACAGSVTKLTQNAFRNFSIQKFWDSFRTSAGFGIIVPTKLFRMEVNYCYILKQHEHDSGKTGVQFSFSSPL